MVYEEPLTKLFLDPSLFIAFHTRGVLKHAYYNNPSVKLIIRKLNCCATLGNMVALRFAFFASLKLLKGILIQEEGLKYIDPLFSSLSSPK